MENKNEKTLLYDNIYFDLPPQPANKKIANHNLPQKFQKFTRTELPEDFNFWSAEKQMEFAEQEDEKCTTGYWFYNNGIPTYITGDHYHYINWCKIDVGYPNYRDKDKRTFYFWQICKDDLCCNGMLFMKNRQEGWSYKSAANILNSARKTFNANYGIISKTGDDAKDLFSRLTYMFSEYPSFFKPQVESGETGKEKLIFRTPQQRVTYKTRAISKELSLNTQIFIRNTKENSFDNNKIKMFAVDEPGKWETADFLKWWKVGRTCMIRFKGTAKAMVGSTVNELKKGGAAFKKMWEDSDSHIRDRNGWTTSGVRRYFIPAFDGLEDFIDEFGMSVIETPKEKVKGIDGEWIKIGAKNFLQNRRDAVKDDLNALYEEMRQFPFTEQEPFWTNNDNISFDIIRIKGQMDFNETLPLSMLPKRGNFRWKDGIRLGEVVWDYDIKGRWNMLHLLPMERRNKYIIKGGKKAPFNHEIVAGLDPFNQGQTISKKRSNAASYVYNMFEPMRPNETDMFICEYVNRPSDPFLMYEDMLMQCIFYGCSMLYEKNKGGVDVHFELSGCKEYLLTPPAETLSVYLETAARQKEIVGVAMTGDKARTALVNNLKHYICTSVGKIQRPDGTFTMGKCYFNNLLDDWAKFEWDNWTDYDATVASGLTILATKDYIPVAQPKIITNEFFRQYSINGGNNRQQGYAGSRDTFKHKKY